MRCRICDYNMGHYCPSCEVEEYMENQVCYTCLNKYKIDNLLKDLQKDKDDLDEKYEERIKEIVVMHKELTTPPTKGEVK